MGRLEEIKVAAHEVKESTPDGIVAWISVKPEHFGELIALAGEAERLRERMRILKQVDATPGNTEHAAFGRDVRQHLTLWDLEDAEDDTK